MMERFDSDEVLAASSVCFLDPTERIKRYGIEVLGPVPSQDGIVFRAGTWAPGGEYVQKFIIRNVCTQTKKIKYVLPTTRYFFMAYPEWVILSPGMFTEVGVVFRPVENNPYDDSVFIKVMDSPNEGGFHVPVNATISKLIITSPPGIDMGFCPTHQITSLTFKLVNDGEIDAPFRWEVPPPFVLEPSEGIIPVGHHQVIKVSVYPLEGTVFVSQAACYVGEDAFAIIPDPIITTKLSAIGKYAYIVLSESEISYKEILSGTPVSRTKKEVLLRNNSVVPAEFTCLRHENDCDEVFEVYPREGIIPPQSSMPITVHYHALAMGTFSLDQYTFKTPGNSHTTLTLSGTTIPPVITMRKDVPGNPGETNFPEGSPHNSINFRNCEVNTSETRLFYLRNSSERDSYYSIDGDEECVFRMHPRIGRIPAGNEVAVKLFFSPKMPINYYKRFFVLIGDALPIFYDVMGTGYIRAKGEIKEQRPFPLRHAHVQAYRNRSNKGYGGMNPDEMDLVVASQADRVSDDFAHAGKAGTRVFATTPYGNPLTRSGECSRNDIAPAHEYFIDDTDKTSREVTISSQNLDFGYCPINTRSETKIVSVTNHTNGKVACNWICSRTRGEIKLQEDEESNKSPHRKKKNANAVDMYSPAFSVSPMQEDINPGQTVNFIVSFYPLQSNRNYVSDLEAFVFFKNQRTFRLVNDTTMTPPWCVTVRGIGHTFSTGQLMASCSLQSAATRQGKLVFPCTYLGDCVYQTVMLKNSTNLPSTFRFVLGWDSDILTGLSHEYTTCTDETFTIKPVSGEIEAESSILICFRFQPSQEKKYVQLLRCIVNGASGGKLMLEGTGGLPCLRMTDLQEAVDTIQPTLPPRTQSQYTRLRTADGALNITLNPGGQVLNNLPNGFQGAFYLKPTSVGLVSSRPFTIKNTSRLPLKFLCSLPDNAMGILSCSPMQGVLRGNQSLELALTFSPQISTQYNFKLRVKSYPVGGRPSKVRDARQPGVASQAQALQKLSVNIVAPADIGAVIFDPQESELPVRLVNTEEVVPIFIENVSDSDLDYFLKFRTKFEAEPGAYGSVGIEGVVDLEIPEPIERGISIHQLFCDEPIGQIPARSRKKLRLTFRPTLAGAFDFDILASVRVVEDGDGVIMDNDKAALLRVSGNEGDRMDEAVENLRGLSLVARLTGRATFPTVAFEDIRSEGESLVSYEQLWKMFSLSEINYDLSLSLTAREFKINNASSPDTSKMNHYSFNFVPDVVGAPLQVIHLRIKNCGFLPSRYRLHLPNEKSIDPEPWCNVDEPTDAALQMISIIEELKSFTIEPKSALLQPGEAVSLRITYNHNFLNYKGYHRMPVLLKIDQGKQMVLEFTGRTLRAERTKKDLVFNSEKCLLFTALNNAVFHELKPVPIGLNAVSAPRQQIEIFNASNTTTAYEVDLSACFALAENNFDQNLFRFVNYSGEIKGKSSALVDVYFYPLEDKDYELPITVYYVDAQAQEIRVGKLRSQRSSKNIGSYQIKLKASGYNPRNGKLVPFTRKYYGGQPPLSQLLNIPSQLVYLSTDTLDFGNVPQYCQSHRLLVLRNLTDSEVSFIMDSTSETGIFSKKLCDLMEGNITDSNKFGQTIKCYPQYGDIEPNGSITISFTFTANCPSAILQSEVKIITRAVIKDLIKKRRPTTPLNASIANGQDMEHIVQHNSVVHRATESHTYRMEGSRFIDGRGACMPSTVNRKGIVEEDKKYGLTLVENSVHEVMGSGSLNRQGTAKKFGFANEGDNIETSGSGFLDDNDSQVRSVSSGKSNRSTPRTRSSGQARVAGSTQKGPLQGPAQVVVARLCAEVFSIETNKFLLESISPDVQDEIKPEFTSQYIMPVDRPFIKPMLYAEDKTATRSSKLEPSRIQALLEERQDELRLVSESIASSLLRDLVDSEELKEYSLSVLAVPQDGLVLCEDLSVSGEPIVGVSFDEIRKIKRLDTALIEAFVEMGYPNTGANKGIYEISITKFFEAIRNLGLTKKGNHMKNLEEVVIELYGTKGGGKLLNVSIVVDKMPVKLASAVRNKILALESTPAVSTESSIEIMAQIVTTTSNGELGGGGSIDEEGSLGSEAKDGAAELATALQRANRLNQDRAKLDKILDREAETKAEQLLASPDTSFLYIVEEILKNTMYNLIQEATNDEFSIDAEPIKFLSSPEIIYDE